MRGDLTFLAALLVVIMLVSVVFSHGEEKPMSLAEIGMKVKACHDAGLKSRTWDVADGTVTRVTCYGPDQ